ncbi:hypothetical protein KIH39_10210 [Telmatocola sphagniphila]|uniref:Secreted protein n=1 Tax=Telmatocola sphagniphila TaxID=1123043 RepID=A0A8E6BAH0_9BACT|nr:hypothetical protein [Telmatocola sphagniphila]QVL34254.1 hypothetical protein KIH39_10210 [Telmatocola sphagniphila]
MFCLLIVRLLCAMGLMSGLVASAVCSEEPQIVFDNRPESGIPAEALQQPHKPSKATTEKEFPLKFPALTAGAIKSIRIRYYNKETWPNEKDAREYVRSFLGNKKSEVFDFQIWSQGVGVPEIECYVEFTEEYRKKLLGDKFSCRDGRLLLWNTEACYRDGTGRWYFVSAFDQFHRAHPKGDRKNVK